jgi:dolichyl-phosphate beta-glucosyltransferase
MVPAGSGGPELSVILPAYNEAPVIARSVERVDSFLRETGRRYEILLGDDGSTDATIPNALAAGCPALRVIAREHAGKGSILTASLSEARGESIGFIDADLEIDIAYLSEFLRLLDDGADAVIARKTDPLEAGRRRPLRRRILTFLYNAAARTLFGTPYRDHQAGMKFFRRSLLQQILPTVRSRGWIWDTEVLVAVRRTGATVAEVPIVTLEVPGRIPKVSWLSTSLAMSRELLILRSQVGRGRANPAPAVEAQADATVAAGARSR